MRARKRLLGRDVVSIGRQPPEVGRPRFHQLRPPVREVRRDLHSHVRHQPLALPDQPLDLVDRDRICPARQLHLSDFALVAATARRGRGCLCRSNRWGGCRRGIPVPCPPRSRGRVGDIRHLGPVVTRVRNEVLEDDLLQMAVAHMDRGEGFQRFDTLLLALADADQDPGGEGDLQLPRGLDRRQPRGGMLGRRAGVDRVHQPLGNGLQHQPLGGRHLPQTSEILTAEHTEIRVGKHPSLQRPLAGPDDVGGEVGVAPLGQPRRHDGVDLGPLAGEDEQLLGVAFERLVQQRLDLLGRVDVRLVRRKGAVLAVALAGA